MNDSLSDLHRSSKSRYSERKNSASSRSAPPWRNIALASISVQSTWLRRLSGGLGGEPIPESRASSITADSCFFRKKLECEIRARVIRSQTFLLTSLLGIGTN